ncbi:MAG: hypothetical protein V4611_03755 [Patescibacteria group bacterium]
MPEIMLNSSPERNVRHVYDRLSDEAKSELVRHAVGVSMADELLRERPYYELEQSNPEFARWASANVAKASQSWARYNNTDVSEAFFPYYPESPDPFINSRSAEQIEKFILDNEIVLKAAYAKAEQHNIDLNSAKLIVFPIRDFSDQVPHVADGESWLKETLDEYRLSIGYQPDEIASAIMKAVDNDENFGWFPLSEYFMNIFGRLDSSTAKNKNWDMFIMSKETTLGKWNNNVKNDDMGIIEWIAATIQEPEWMLSDRILALPPNTLESNGTSLMVSASGSLDDKTFHLDLLPTTYPAFAKRSVARGY